MDGTKTVFPDIISSRLEDLYGAPLPDEEYPLYMEGIRKAADLVAQLARDDSKEEAQALLDEIASLSERGRRLCMRFAYIQGLQDGCVLRDVLSEKTRP